ncbi:hypothetical protein BO221_42620 [Archangium sp. Cb G35]|uniref:hypothetical protein n=1 Tax=Archangium sp. Cb G35 TaxID=1920190 RepID=UPI000935A1BB|nr:hypothetical protein [Archangium sp. Cb G35]OJT18179.1 hypothetical protein BO221_42620 [Archangium sp. Cb G35]
MAKHQLIISKDINGNFPVRSEEGQLKTTRTLVVNWKRTWEPRDRADLFLVVAPGDELEVVLAEEQREGGSLWLYNRVNPLRSLLVPLPEGPHRDGVMRVDLQKGSVILTVDPAIARDAGESRYDLRISALGGVPAPFVGQGQAGTLTASKP